MKIELMGPWLINTAPVTSSLQKNPEKTVLPHIIHVCHTTKIYLEINHLTSKYIQYCHCNVFWFSWKLEVPHDFAGSRRRVFFNFYYQHAVSVCANDRAHYASSVVFVCLYIAASYYGQKSTNTIVLTVATASWQVTIKWPCRAWPVNMVRTYENVWIMYYLQMKKRIGFHIMILFSTK